MCMLDFFLDSRSCDVRPNKYFRQHKFFKTSLPPSRCLFFFKLVAIFYKWDHQHVVFKFQAVASSCSHVPGCSNLTGRARRTILFRWRKTKQTTKQTTKQNKHNNNDDDSTAQTRWILTTSPTTNPLYFVYIVIIHSTNEHSPRVIIDPRSSTLRSITLSCSIPNKSLYYESQLRLWRLQLTIPARPLTTNELASTILINYHLAITSKDLLFQ